MESKDLRDEPDISVALLSPSSHLLMSPIDLFPFVRSPGTIHQEYRSTQAISYFELRSSTDRVND